MRKFFCILFVLVQFLLQSDLLLAQEGEVVATKQEKVEKESEKIDSAAQKKTLRKKKKTINAFLAERGIFYWHLNLRYINDFQNGNIRAGMDDRYTYGVTILFGLNNWDFFLRYRSLTDRYQSKTRIDELEWRGQYTWGNLLNPDLWTRPSANFNRRPEAQYSPSTPFYLGFTFGASFLHTGDLSGEIIQNAMHELTKVPKVYGDYLPGTTTLGFHARSYFSYSLGLKGLGEDLYLELGTSMSLGLEIGYRETVSLGVTSKLYSGNNYVQFELRIKQMGYLNEFVRSDSATSLWADTNSAVWFAFSSRAGLYQRRVDISFGSFNDSEERMRYGFGFGSFEISWHSLEKQKIFKKPDYSHSLLTGIENTIVLDRFSYMFDITGKIPFALSFLAMRDLSADPRLFVGKPLARKQEAGWFLMGHIRPTLDLQKFGSLEFYAGIGFGFMTMQFIVPVDATFEQIKSREGLQNFAIAGQAGIRWYGLALRREGAVYGIEVALLSLLPFSDMDNNVRFSDANIIIQNLRPSFSLFIGISVLVDL